MAAKNTGSARNQALRGASIAQTSPAASRSPGLFRDGVRLTAAQQAILLALKAGDRLVTRLEDDRPVYAATGKRVDGRSVAALQRRGLVHAELGFPLFADGRGELTERGRVVMR